MFCWTLPLRAPMEDFLAVVSVGHRLYNFGGCPSVFGTPRGECHKPMCLYTFNTVSLRWARLYDVTEQPEVVPTGRRGHSAVLVEDIVYVLGDGVTVDKRLYAFHVDARRWLKTEASGSVPEARCYHSACALLGGKVMYIHGGELTADTGYTNDTYKLDTATMVWSSVNTRGAPPPATGGHSATVIGTKMFVFGGHGDRLRAEEYGNNVRVFDTETDLWQAAAGLPERTHSHAAFAHDGELYVFSTFRGTFKGLWRFNTKTLSWKKVEPKGRRPFYISVMHCHTVGDRVLLLCRGLYILDLSPSLQTFCKLAVIGHGLEQSQLPHNLKWELAAMASGGNWHLVSGPDHWTERFYGDKWYEVEEVWNGRSVETVRRWELVGGIWQRVGPGSG